MITVNEADKILAKSLISSPAVDCRLEDADGTILREDIRADRDIPACDKILMDGVAIRHAEWVKGRRTFVLNGIQAAGVPRQKLRSPAECLEVMTGAVLPLGCDCVVPVEQVTIRGREVTITGSGAVHRMQNVQPQGSDRKKGGIVLKKGEELTPARIAVAASVGRAVLKVSRRPKVTVITTGDELIEVGRKPAAHQIRKSNSHALRAALIRHGYPDVSIVHVRDDQKQMLRVIGAVLKNSDILVLSGGVSMGKFDFVPVVLKQLGVKVVFHKVAQKPGKPFWFGTAPKGKAVFALPGNSVSTQVCCYRYVLPSLDKMTGLGGPAVRAVLNKSVSVKTDLTLFLPVRISQNRTGVTQAIPNPISHSGDFVGLSESDGFVELAAGKKIFPKGSVVPLYQW